MKINPLSFSGKVKLIKTLENIRCPGCKERVEMHIMRSSVVPIVFYSPTVNLRKTYIAICSKCSKKFRLRSSSMKTVMKGR